MSASKKGSHAQTLNGVGAQSLIASIEARSAVVGVIGLGYVGLPLAATFHRAGFQTLGFDTNQEVIDAIGAGKSYLEHLPDSEALFRSLKESERFAATTDMKKLREVDIAIICVPTPLGDSFEPDLTYVEESTRSTSSAHDVAHICFCVISSWGYMTSWQRCAATRPKLIQTVVFAGGLQKTSNLGS